MLIGYNFVVAVSNNCSACKATNVVALTLNACTYFSGILYCLKFRCDGTIVDKVTLQYLKWLERG